MIYGYLRVSTEKQNLENQDYELKKFAKESNCKIDKIIQEKKSGTISYKDRDLGKLLRKVKKGDIIICSEISRLGRNLYMIMDILNKLSKKGVAVWTVKENFRLDSSISSKVISFAFSLCAEIERNLISQRTKEALAARKAAGMKLGRPFGGKNKVYKLDKYKEKIIKMIEANINPYQIQKACHKCGINTLKNWMKRNNIKYKNKKEISST